MPTRAFTELVSHYLFEDRFGCPGKGNDKGKVEGLVKFSRANFLTPVPHGLSFDALNAGLVELCLARQNERAGRHEQTIGERLAADTAALRDPPAAPFEPCHKCATKVTTKQLVAFDRRYESKTRNRLTALYHEEGKWLERLSESIKFANSLFVDEMYRLGKDAEDLLQWRGIVPSEDWVGATRIGGNSAAPSRILRLAHDHMASQIALDIEIGARAAPGVCFRNHVEIISASPARTQTFPNPLNIAVPPIADAPRWIEPDALFAIDERYFALEADMGTESIEAVIKPKIRAYRQIVATGTIDDHFGIENLAVLFVTTNEKRMRNIMKAVESIARNGRSTMFAFACRPDLAGFTRAPAPDGRVFREPWRRVGHEDLRLDAERCRPKNPIVRHRAE